MDIGEQTPLTKGGRMAMFVNMMITCIALAIISTGTSTALPPLMHDFGIDASLGQWVTSGYSLALAIGTLLTAYLVMRLPLRPLYIVAVGLITICLVAAALAPTFEALMAARIIQALGNALIASMTMVTILTIFPEGEKGTVMGWYGTSQGAAVVVGPVVGGVLIDTFGWRSLFWTVAAICAVSFVLALFCMRSVLPTEKGRFDVTSFLLSAVAFGGLTYGIGAFTNAEADKSITSALLIVAIVCGALFVRRQLTLKNPFLNIRLFSESTFTTAVILSMLLYAVMMGVATIIPLYVEITLGDSATVAGAVTAPGALLMAVCAPIVGQIYDRHGIRRLALGGAAVMLFSNVAMLVPGLATSSLMVGVLYTLRCMGIVMVQMPLITWGLGRLNVHDMVHGQALLTALRNIAGSMGIVVFASVMSLAGVSNPAGMSAAFTGISIVSIAFLAIVAFYAKNNEPSK